MPIDTGVWRIDGKLRQIEPQRLDLENRLEEILAADVTIASPNWLVIGRQIRTDYGKFIDLLAIDRDGNLIILELKRDRTPRDIVAQVLDYGSWVRGLEDEQIARIYDDFVTKYHPERSSESLDQRFVAHFGLAGMPDELNQQHELVIVASDLDPGTERIVNYLADEYGVEINAIFFRVYKDGGAEYLVRAWLREPTEVEAPRPERESARGTRGEWNGEYYVSFGHDPEGRNWEEARRYGFVSAGGGAWYSRTLSGLEPGARVWANVPGHGYAGVGTVKEGRVPIDDFMVVDDKGKKVRLLDVPKIGMGRCNTFANDPETAEYLVRVEWLHSVPLEEAVKERGFFGNQNTVAQPRSSKWDHTVERLKKRFGIAGKLASDPA